MLSLALAFPLLLSVHGALLTAPQQLTSLNYDFVIVGAGTAGNVMANRLTEDPKVKVLVVEAGISNANNLDITVPFLGVSAAGTSVDWNYTTTPQLGLNNRSIPFARGFVLGGSSSINLLAWTRGSNDVWDNYARLTGDPGWSWNAVQQFYLQTSRLVAPADGHNTTGQVNPKVHGNGPVETSVEGFPTELDNRVIGASKFLGGEFSFNLDYNAGNLVGFGWIQSSIGGGERSSSATAYLQPVLNRPNLDVLINTQATKLIPDPIVNRSVPTFRTLEIAQSSAGPTFRVTASKEIILCGGVVGSPQLLLLSGIGPQ
ncbi:GMC oxidoreductase, partial [Sphaerobolus stellatus SS14]